MDTKTPLYGATFNQSAEESVMNTRIIKNIACLTMAGAIVLGTAACGKPSGDKLRSAAEKLSAEEYEIDDLEELEEKKLVKALDKGILIETDGDELQDVFDIDDEMFSQLGDAIDVDLDDCEIDDFSKITAYIRAEDIDKMTTGNTGIVDGTIAVVVEFDDKDKANDVMADLMDVFEETMEEDFDVDVSALNKQEYRNSKNKAQFVIHLTSDDVIDLVESVFDNLDGDAPTDLVKELIKAYEDVELVLGIYYDNGVLTILMATNDGIEDLDMIAGKLGIKKPSTVENSDEMYNTIEGLLNDMASMYLVKAKEASELMKQHQEEVAEIQAAIDDSL